MRFHLFEKIRDFFWQPASADLEVVRPLEIDLAPYFNSIGYLCMQLRKRDDPVGKTFSYTGLIDIHAHDGSVDGETNPFEAIITVIFDDREVTIEEIIRRLKNIGVNTRIFH